MTAQTGAETYKLVVTVEPQAAGFVARAQVTRDGTCVSTCERWRSTKLAAMRHAAEVALLLVKE